MLKILIYSKGTQMSSKTRLNLPGIFPSRHSFCPTSKHTQCLLGGLMQYFYQFQVSRRIPAVGRLVLASYNLTTVRTIKKYGWKTELYMTWAEPQCMMYLRLTLLGQRVMCTKICFCKNMIVWLASLLWVTVCVCPCYITVTEQWGSGEPLFLPDKRKINKKVNS